MKFCVLHPKNVGVKNNHQKWITSTQFFFQINYPKMKLFEAPKWKFSFRGVKGLKRMTTDGELQLFILTLCDFYVQINTRRHWRNNVWKMHVVSYIHYSVNTLYFFNLFLSEIIFAMLNSAILKLGNKTLPKFPLKNYSVTKYRECR